MALPGHHPEQLSEVYPEATKEVQVHIYLHVTVMNTWKLIRKECITAVHKDLDLSKI